MAGGPDPVQFATAVLQRLGAPVNQANIAGFIGWSKAEGPLGSSNWQRNNPLNTTEPAGASGAVNSAGVRVYPDMGTGIAATVRTLQNGRYGAIIQAFRQSNPTALGRAIAGSPWGTGALAQQTIAQTLGQKFNATASPGALPPMPGSSAAGMPSAPSGPNPAATAENYLKGSAKSPYDIGPSTGLSSGESILNPELYKAAQNSLQSLAGSQPLAVHPGAVSKYKGYVNPLHGFTLGRTDMGVDANAQPGTPILALGDSKVLGIMPGWYQGQPYMALQLLNGPKAGQIYYVAEQIDPLVKPGQVVHTGEPIARYAQHGTGIEVGWAGPNWQQTRAQATGNTGDASHGNSPAGMDFRSFLTAL